ncbi:MAG: transposase [Fuerstiella sp.]|nr:transposase [Fuerstiella sp.]
MVDSGFGHRRERHQRPRQRFKTEEIIQKLREAEVLLSQGKDVATARRQIGVTDNTCYRWRKEYGGNRTDQAKRLKDAGEAERSIEEAGGRSRAGQGHSTGGGGKLLSPLKHRRVG